MKVIIMGAGNWGTTLGILFAEKNQVNLWTLTEVEAICINQDRENKDYLPKIKLPDNIMAEKKFSSPIDPEDIVIVAVPSRKMHDISLEFKQHGYDSFIFVNVSKGVDHHNLKTVEETVVSCLPKIRFANLSGPTIARELAEGLPAKAVLASNDIELLFYLQQKLQNSLLFFEFSTDIKGIELTSSLKGLIAIAIGIADGLGFKTNIYGLIMTQGLNEFETLMAFLNVNPKTVYGIAGMGDLITTCLSENSRNRKFGKYLAQGMSTDDALKTVGMEVEGVSMAKTVMKFTQLNLNLPLINFVVEAIFSHINIREKLLKVLMNRKT